MIVVDDGSQDGSAAILESWAREPGFCILWHPRNRGKGAAVRSGLAHAQGQITMIQDADLEYDPRDYPKLVEIIRRGESPVVYGSRYKCPANHLPWNRFRLAAALVNGLVFVLYGQRVSDEPTCYKALRTDLFRSLDLKAERFEICAEITGKLCQLGLRIVEVPISYHPRSKAEGKKIGWRDVWPTIWGLLKWRFASPSPRWAARIWHKPFQPLQHTRACWNVGGGNLVV